MTTAGAAAPTAAMTLGASKISSTAGVTPARSSSFAVCGERVVPVTSCPARSRSGTSRRPMAPEAPARNTFMRRPFERDDYRAFARLGIMNQSHLAMSNEGAARRALGRDTSPLPPTRWHRARHCRCAARAMSYSPCQTAQFLRSRLVLPPGSLPSSFLLRRCRPPSEGIGGAPRDVQPCTCRAVTRDATLARQWHLPRNQEARLTALRRGAVGPGPASVPVAGSGAKAPRHLAFLPGCGAGLFVSAVTSRGRRHIPLRLQDRLAKAPLMSGIFAT